LEAEKSELIGAKHLGTKVFNGCWFGRRGPMQFAAPTPPRNTKLEEAIRLFESHADYPGVQALIYERLKEADQARAHIDIVRREELLEWVIERFDIRAKASLDLVSDIAWQNAYKVQLQWWELVTWQDYERALPVPPAGDQAKKALLSIQARTARWVNEGYQRLDKLRQLKTSSVGDSAFEQPLDASRDRAVDATAMQRRTSVDAYIAQVRETGREITRAPLGPAAGALRAVTRRPGGLGSGHIPVSSPRRSNRPVCSLQFPAVGVMNVVTAAHWPNKGDTK
jgi:hypothetical protein